MRNNLIVFLLLCVLFLPSTFVRDLFYPDETRNFYIASTMEDFESSFIIDYGDYYYFEKPPFYFWLINPIVHGPASLRLPLAILINIICTFIILTLNYRLIKKEENKEIAFLASLFVLSSTVFLGMVFAVRMDILFLCFIFCAFYYLYRIHNEGKTYHFFLCSLFIFLSIFTKGLLGALYIFFAGIIFLWKDKRKLLMFLGFYVFVFYYVAIWFAIGYGFFGENYIKELLFKQTAERALSPHSHSGGLFFYFMRHYVFLPGLLFPLAWFFKRKKECLKTWQKLYLLWLIIGFIILSLIKTKVEIYLLTIAVPFLSLGACLFRKESKVANVLVRFSSWIFVPITIGFIASFKHIPPQVRPYALITVLLLATFCIMSLRDKRLVPAVKKLLYGWLVMCCFASVTVCVSISARRGLKGVAEVIKDARGTQPIERIFVTKESLFGLSLYGVGETVFVSEPATVPPGAFIVSRDELDGCRLIGKNYKFLILQKE